MYFNDESMSMSSHRLELELEDGAYESSQRVHLEIEEGEVEMKGEGEEKKE